MKTYALALTTSHYPFKSASHQSCLPTRSPSHGANPWGKPFSKKAQKGGGWLIANHPSKDGRTVAANEKIKIADNDHLSDVWFMTEILGGLNGADVEFVYPSANDGE